jgi:hypothetical protein
MKLAYTFVLTLLAAAPSVAQNAISWVSQRSGNDGNSCSVTSPCQTFQGAYAKTNNNGVIKALDAGEYGPLFITKPIIIDGNGVAAIESMVPGTSGVLASGAGEVEIRNLSIHVMCGICDGIDSSNSSINIENVSISGQTAQGVYVLGGSGTIHNVSVAGATSFGIYVQDATATISDSDVRRSSTGIFVQGISAVTQTLIERSKTISNTTGLLVQSAGSAATARLSDCVITANATGISTISGGQIITLRNNTWAGNGTDGSTPFSISLK